jgi:hypothetical protein
VSVCSALNVVPITFTTVNVRGGAFMLTVLARLTLWKTKNKKSSALLSWFSGSLYTGTQQNRSNKTNLAISSQPGVVSQLVES